MDTDIPLFFLEIQYLLLETIPLETIPLETIMRVIPRKGNIKSRHYNTVVKACLIDDLEVVASPEVACGFRHD